MTGQLLVLAAILLLSLPFFLLYGPRGGVRRVSDAAPAVAMCLAFLSVAGWCCAWAGHLDAVMLVWGALGVRAVFRVRRERASWAVPRDRYGAAALLCGAASVLWIVLGYDVPSGWDPACHALIAEKIARSGALSRDWLPFEDLAMHYPQALHCPVALLARLTGQPVHVVLQALHAAIQIPALVLLWRIVRRVFGGPAAAAAAVCYAFGTHTGNFYYYYRLGMFPTELAGLFFLLLIDESMTRRRLAVGALAGCGIVWVHFLSLAMIAWVLACFAVFSLRRMDRRMLRSMAVSLGLALVLSAPYWLYMLFGQIESGSGESIRFSEEAAFDWYRVPDEIGPAVLVLSIAGFWSLRRARREKVRFATVWPLALLGIFLLMEYGFRYAVARPFFGEDFTILIPSRFLAVSGYGLSIVAGYALARIFRKAPLAGRIAAALIVCWGVWGIYGLFRQRAVSADFRSLAAALREKTPENACCVLPAGTPDYQWLAYFAWRATPGLPLPSSEKRAAVIPKVMMLTDPDRNRAEIGRWIAREKIPVLLLIPRPDHWYAAVGGADGRFRLVKEPLAVRK